MTNLRIDVLQAVSFAASNEETRYYLKGVCVTCSLGRVTYVATNGHLLLADCVETPDCVLNGTWIIPIDVINGLKITRSSGEDATLSVDGNMLTIDHAGKRVTFAPVDGSFPYWPNVVPRSHCDKAANFNFELFGVFAKAAKKAGYGKPYIRQNDEGPALVRFQDSQTAFGVLMPMRLGDRAMDTPGWVPGANN